jgi:rubrerythrin
MLNEITELLNIAMDREIVSQAFYIAGQKKTQDPGGIELMKELSYQELKHCELIKRFKENYPNTKEWYSKKLPDLMISEYLVDINLSESAGLQDIITIAMKREQYSIEFYSRMKKLAKGQAARQLCELLAKEEFNHKVKLEKYYEDFFLKEN